MATSTILSNPVVTINSVDLTDQSKTAEISIKYDALEVTAFGGSSRVYSAGLGDHEFKVTLYMSYAATETWATLKSLVGTTTTVVIQAAAGTASATNPKHTLTGCYLEELPSNFQMGELNIIDIVFKGGVYTTVEA